MELVIGNLVGFTIGTGLVLIYLKFSEKAYRVERKVDLLLKHAGLDFEKSALEEAATVLRTGKKIDAIQYYRELTGCSLAAAKARIESVTNAATS
jgi:ribosomal protein L7/L12